MKKLFCAMLTLCVLLSAGSALAVTNSASIPTTPVQFDVSMLEGQEGYEYDAFDRDWTYHQAYVRRFNDARVVIGLQLDGDAEGVTPVQLYCWIRDQNNRSVLYEPTSMSIMIGSDIYRIPTLLKLESSSTALLGPDAAELLQAMSNADTITVRLAWSGSNIDIEIPRSDYVTTLKVGARVLLECNALNAYDYSEYNTLVTLYGQIEKY